MRCLALYRWPRYDPWYIEGKDGVVEDFLQAVARGYRWDEPDPAPLRKDVIAIVAGLVVYVIFAGAHQWLFGFPPFPM